MVTAPWGCPGWSQIKVYLSCFQDGMGVVYKKNHSFMPKIKLEDRHPVNCIPHLGIDHLETKPPRENWPVKGLKMNAKRCDFWASVLL